MVTSVALTSRSVTKWFGTMLIGLCRIRLWFAQFRVAMQLHFRLRWIHISYIFSTEVHQSAAFKANFRQFSKKKNIVGQKNIKNSTLKEELWKAKETGKPCKTTPQNLETTKSKKIEKFQKPKKNREKTKTIKPTKAIKPKNNSQGVLVKHPNFLKSLEFMFVLVLLFFLFSRGFFCF